MKNWGKDHWSLLIFIETQVVDSDGTDSAILDLRRMRVNSTKRHFGNGVSFGWEESWGTRFKDGVLDGQHDDIDVMNDLIDAGLVENTFTELNPIVRLTDSGLEMCNKVRNHKARGGVFSNFNPE